MNRRSSTVLIGSIVIGVAVMLGLYMCLIVTGVIDTRPSALVVTIHSAQKEFDGEPLTCEEYTIKKGVLKKGHKLEVTFGAQQTEVGWVENTAVVKVTDAIGADVTNHYQVETNPGKLTVTKRKLVFKSGDMQKVYDGTPLTHEMWDPVVGTLPEGYTASATFTGAQTIPGASDNSFAIMIQDAHGRPAHQNFDVSCIYGKLIVTKRPLTVTSYGASKIYDGLPLTYEHYTVDGEILSEHRLNVTFPTSTTADVGSVTNNIIVAVLSDYADVTPYYDIDVRVGTLKIEPRPIEISASPCIKHYSGSALPAGQWYITKGSLVDGHDVYADVEAVKNAEGTVEFMLRNVGIYESWGKTGGNTRAGGAVTHNYDITLVHGIDRDQLEQLVFTSGSQSAPYTGEPLICEQYVLSAGTLEQGYEVVPHFTGSQTEIGFSDNTFTVSIIDLLTGEDVTYRYDVDYDYGMLEVYQNAPSTGGEISDDGGLDNDVRNEDAVAARVWAQSGGRVYLRWKSYGDYSFRESAGNWGWGDAMAYPLASENMLYTVGQTLAADGKLPVQYRIELLGNQYLIPNYIADGPEGANNDVVISPLASSYTLSGYNWNYSYADALRYGMSGLEDEQNQRYAAFVTEQYLRVPESTKQALLEFAEQHGVQAGRPSTIEDIASLVRSSADYNMEYPECPAGKDEVVYFLTESQSGVCRHFASAATLLYRSMGYPARYVVGYATNAAAQSWTDVKGADAHAWVEVFIPGFGWIRIDPTPAQSNATGDTLELTPWKIRGVYTGEPYRVLSSPESVSITKGSLKPGHTITDVQISGEQRDAGTGSSIIESVVIRDENGVDVTSQYNIVCKPGIIEVEKPLLTVTAESVKIKDNGTVLVNSNYSYVFKNTAPGEQYTVVAEVTGSQQGVGYSDNVVGDVFIYNEDGDDVTSNFEINRVKGKLTIYLYELLLSSQGATKVYDGTPLSAPELHYDAETLASRGHTLEYTMPSITNVGSVRNSPSTSSCRVVDSRGNDVTKEYDLQIDAGTLRITAIRLTIVTDSAEKVYDGRALRAEGYTLTSGTMALGQSIVSYQITGSQTNVGVSDATVTDIVIVDALGRNVTANYQITIIPGTLRVLAP